MAIQSSFYEGTSLDVRDFPSTKHIATKRHMAVWVQLLADDTWVEINVNSYELINNRCVLTTLLDQTLYKKLEVRVADNPDELISSPSDTAILASIATEVTALAGIEAELTVLGANATGLENISDNLAEVLDADVQAGNALQSATDAQTAQGLSESARDASVVAKDASVVAQGLAETAQAGAELAETNAKASELAIDSSIVDNRSSMVVNNITTEEPLILNATPTIGQTEFLYTGTGVERTVATTGVQIANDNGDGTTLASAWSNTSYAVGTIVYDTSVTGDSLPYECTVEIVGATGVSPRADVDDTSANWKLSDNQFGYKGNIKGRSGATSHMGFDSIQGLGKYISSNTTAIQVTDAQSTTTISPFSITLGTALICNTNLATYVLEVEQTTRRTSGTLVFDVALGRDVVVNSIGTYDGTGTYDASVHASLCEVDSQGNPVIIHDNPVQGNGIRFRYGNSVAGANAPTNGVLTKLLYTKALTGAVTNWGTYDFINGAKYFMQLNTTALSALGSTIWNDTEPTLNTFTYGNHSNINALNVNYIDYYYGETPNTKIVSYQGTGNVGNDALNNIGMDCTDSGTKAKLKRLDAVGDWVKKDNVRGGANSLYSNLSSAEGIAHEVTFTDTGIIIDNTLTSSNALNGTYLAIIHTPSYNQPIGGKYIGFKTNIKATLADGKANEANKTALVDAPSLAQLDVGTGNANTTQHVYLKGDATVVNQPYPLNSGLNRADADKWGVDVLDANGVVTGKTTARHGTYASDTGFVSASSELSATYPIHKVFDKINSTGWISIASTTANITYSLSKKRVLISYSFTSDGTANRTPLDYTIKGLNSDGTWTTLESVTGNINTVAFYKKPKVTLANTTAYLAYKLDVTAIQVGGLNVGLSEIDFQFAVDDTPYLNITDNVIYTDVNDTVTDTFTELGTAVVDGTETVSHITQADTDVVQFSKAVFHDEVEFEKGTIGANQCSAWVNFDGTTTPVTIKDSYNVKDVIRTSTGLFDIIFEKELDNDNYSWSLGSDRATAPISAYWGGAKRVDKFSFGTANTSLVPINAVENSCIIFGGKK